MLQKQMCHSHEEDGTFFTLQINPLSLSLTAAQDEMQIHAPCLAPWQD